jgi:ubiquinone/menaquinone biosynthesis C-methylase UbiE
VRVTRDDKSPIRLAKRWLSRHVTRVRTALAPPRTILLGFAEFQVIVAGLRLGLFDLLAEKPTLTTEQIRDHLQIPDHSARALLLSCTSLGFVERHPRHGTYRNTPKIHRLFVGPERGLIIPHLEAFHFLMYQPFYHLTGALQQGTNVGLQCVPGSGNTLYDRLESSAENRRIFYGWMKSIKHGSSVPSEVVATLRDRRHLLDIGGGDGDNAIELAKQLPDLNVTIIDLADTCGLAAKNVAKAGLSQRIETNPGNFLEDPLPQGADAIMFAHIFNIYSDEMNQALVKKCADALPKGGKLIIYGLMSHDDQMGPWYAGFMALYFQVLATGVGNVYPPSRYESWFTNAGFSSLTMHTRGPGIFIGTK